MEYSLSQAKLALCIERKKMKQYIGWMLIILLLITVPGCGKENKAQKSASASLETTTQSEETLKDKDTEKEPLKIAILTGPSGALDDSFNKDNYNGILAYVGKHPGSSVTPIEEKADTIEEAAEETRLLVDDYDAIVCCGFQFVGITAIAKAHPEIAFILVDAFPVDENGDEVELDNVYAMQFAEQEGGFLAGMAAALETATNKVAVINGEPFPSNVNYQYGFECGVKYVNETEGTEVEVVELPAYAGKDVNGVKVGGNYVGSFNNEEKGQVIANKLIAKGCDILFVAAGGSGNGAYEAAQKADSVMLIASDIDRYDDGVKDGGNIVLTSVLKNMALNVEKQLEKVADGSFKGENVVLHADTDSIGFVSDLERCGLSEESIEKMNAALTNMINGTIVPAANFNGITPEDFTTIEIEKEAETTENIAP